jgi:hypothetical protein
MDAIKQMTAKYRRHVPNAFNKGRRKANVKETLTIYLWLSFQKQHLTFHKFNLRLAFPRK